MTPLQRRFKDSVLASLLLGSLMGMPGAELRAQQGAGRLFDEAGALYQQEDYQAALNKYQQIEDSGLTSAALLYNVGNCHYKLNQIGKAILYYERAIRQSPGDDDIEANLRVARQATLDRIELPGEFAMAKWLISAVHLVPFPLVVRIAGTLYVLLFCLLILRVLTNNRRLKSWTAPTCVSVGALLALTTALCALQWWDLRNRIEAIVQAEEITARSSPGPEATEVFTIHEGLKVRIDQQTAGWVEIILPDGKAGWVPEETVERI